MKILVHDRSTRRYYAGMERWTANEAEAHDFQRSLPAIEYARAHSLTRAELVYDFGEDREKIVMPILLAHAQRPDSLAAKA